MKTTHLQHGVSWVLILLIVVNQCFLATALLSPWNRRIVRKPTGSSTVVNVNDQTDNVQPSTDTAKPGKTEQSGDIVVDFEHFGELSYLNSW